MESNGTGGFSTSTEEISSYVHEQSLFLFYQQLTRNVMTTCFHSCINRPGPRLSRREIQCLGNCTDRYIEAFTVVNVAYTELENDVRKNTTVIDKDQEFQDARVFKSWIKKSTNEEFSDLQAAIIVDQGEQKLKR